MLAVLTIVSAGVSTSVIAVQAGSVPPVGQLLPGAADTAVAVRTLVPVSGLLTVTEEVTVTVAPGAMSPVHTAPVAPTDSVPELAVASPLPVAWLAIPLAVGGRR